MTAVQAARFKAFNDAKFGCFIHWGAYSAGGVEASWPVMLGPELQARFVEALHRMGMTEVEMPPVAVTLEEYERLPQRFTAERFDADAWADLFRSAGQKYAVLTTKHHDGFALFDTATTDYKSTNTPFGRDVMKELAAACRTAGVQFGTYFSAPDFHDDGYRDRSQPLPSNFLGQPERPEWSGFLDRMDVQVRELCSNYGELFSFWWDIGFGPQWPIERFHGLVRELQPGCVINDRLGGLAAGIDPALAADFLTPEQAIPSAIPRRSTFKGPADPTLLFSLIQRDDWSAAVDAVAPKLRTHFEARPDPTVPPVGDLLPWEACMTFGGQWAWSPDLKTFKSGADIIRALVETASRGGNLLMNVGPRGDGSIQPEFATALRTVGDWLAQHGAGVYGTTFGPLQGLKHVRSTASDRHIYLHLLPEAASRIELEAELPVAGGRVLGSAAPVTVLHENGRTVIDLGRAPRHPVITLVELDRR